jgi:hypothetical protein
LRDFAKSLLDFVAANICVYFQCLFMHFVCANIFGAFVLKPRFKIDVVIMIICSIVIIINSVLTLQVSTASLPHDCGPCEIRLCSSTLDSLHTCVCVWSHRVRVRLSGPIITAGNLNHFWGFPQASFSGLSLCRTTVIYCTPSSSTFTIYYVKGEGFE